MNTTILRRAGVSFIKQKLGKGLYNASSEDFIPIACHYDKNTLLTKNGELLQIFQINGINSERISRQLSNLRGVVRSAISNNVEGDKLAFWIHTIRRKANLDDPVPYHNVFSANIHEIWKNKNYWHDKFVNCLYITVLHDAPELKLKNLNSMINSLSASKIADFEISYFAKSVKTLSATVDKLILDLEEYGAVKLGIRIEEEHCYSDLMFLYRRIMQLNEEQCVLPLTDISTALSSHQYTVGNDMIEVIGDNGKKFAALLSIKEYQEVSSDALDKFLQIPVEMVATEVFYFVDKGKVIPLFEDQSYIADISGDAELKSLSGLEKILKDTDDKNYFCHQQISCMIIGDDAAQLNKQVKQASDTLAKIGIVHVREDINLEKTFWAQLPGNFAFLSRMSPTILDNTAALASLHNFPTGNQYNPWGRAVTLLRTERGTPYFMNFHDTEGNSNTCILGVEKSGRTTLLNFLLSEADKYKPTIIHIVDDSDSSLYIKAKGGKWIEKEKNLFNPLFLEDNEKNRNFCFTFFTILAKHHFDPLKEPELALLKAISEQVFSLPKEKRKLSTVIDAIEDSESGQILKKRLKEYITGGIYYEIFESSEEIVINPGEILAINVQQFDDGEYKKKYFPKEVKFVAEFEYALNTMRSVKAAIVYFMQNLLAKIGEGPKIFAIDNMAAIFNLRCYSEILSDISQNIGAANGVFVNTVNIRILEDMYKNSHELDWLNLMGTQIIIPPEFKIPNLEIMLQLNPAEAKKLATLTINTRMFLIKQEGRIIAAELSIGGLPGMTRLLSSGKLEIEAYEKIIRQYPSNQLEDWVGPLYEELNNIT
ncbi:MAG: VirB4 family type IV secretion/conjugal transfer ATPase [Rickettsiaceae bacterium]|nr:VirB4 family type IV secretion/conjugal transfer ATPase [Rickettsiaceae bacterium]